MATLKFDRTELAAMLSKLPHGSDAIQLVKDDGIYLMSFAEKAPEGTPADQKNWARTVVYAEGYNPHKDNDVWEACCEAVGGDDFGEPYMTRDEWQKVLADSVGGIVLKVTQSSICVAYKPAVRTAKVFKKYDIFKGVKTGKWRIVKDPTLAGKAGFLFLDAFTTKKAAAERAKEYAAEAARTL